jgi:hypothetical protein
MSFCLDSIRLGKINKRFSVLLCRPHAYNEADPGSTEVALACEHGFAGLLLLKLVQKTISQASLLSICSLLTTNSEGPDSDWKGGLLSCCPRALIKIRGEFSACYRLHGVRLMCGCDAIGTSIPSR